LPLRDGNGAVHRVQRRWNNAIEHFVELDDLAPARLRERRSECMLGCDACFCMKAGERFSARGPLQPRGTGADLILVPQQAILFFEEH
jgi:hypothetical protein